MPGENQKRPNLIVFVLLLLLILAAITAVLILYARHHTHEYGRPEVTTPATCSAEGVMTYSCTCGDKITEPIPTIEHTMIESKVTREPT